MSALKPGLYRATVRGVADQIVALTDSAFNDPWVSLVGDDQDNRWHRHEQITDARPLIVLDLAHPGDAINALRMAARDGTNGDARPIYRDIADQVEAQTKPARIPEPGWDGKVLAHTESNPIRREFVRYGARPIPSNFNWNDSLANGAEQWDALIDPTLIREGVES